MYAIELLKAHEKLTEKKYQLRFVNELLFQNKSIELTDAGIRGLTQILEGVELTMEEVAKQIMELNKN